MPDPEKNIPHRIRRVEQKLQLLLKKDPLPARQLTDRISGTSEETANLFSSGTTPAVRMILESR